MKQPKVTVEPIDYYDGKGFWIDVESDDGDFCIAAIAQGKTKATALRAAIRRLERLTRDCKRQLASEQ